MAQKKKEGQQERDIGKGGGANEREREKGGVKD